MKKLQKKNPPEIQSCGLWPRGFYSFFQSEMNQKEALVSKQKVAINERPKIGGNFSTLPLTEHESFH